MTAVASSILGYGVTIPRTYVTRQEVANYYANKKLRFEDEKTPDGILAGFCFGGAATLVITGVALSVFFGIQVAPNEIWPVATLGSVFGAVAIASLIPAIVITVKRKKYLSEKLDQAALEKYLVEMKKQAADALVNTKLGYRFKDAFNEIQWRIEALQDIPDA